MGFSDFMANYVKDHDEIAVENAALSWTELGSLLGDLSEIKQRIEEAEEELSDIF